MADQKFELPNVLLALRNELELAQANAENENLKFSLQEIEIEVQVAVTSEAKAKGGVKFWVYEAGAEGSIGKQTVHTVKLKMKPDNSGGGKTYVSDEVDEIPE